MRRDVLMWVGHLGLEKEECDHPITSEHGMLDPVAGGNLLVFFFGVQGERIVILFQLDCNIGRVK